MPDSAREHLLNLTDAAAYVGLSKSHFARNYKKWKIPFIKIGRKVLFRRAYLDAFLKRHTDVG